MNTDVEFAESTQLKPMSGMAVTGFVLTLLFCIPVLPLVGLLLGLAALGRTAVPNGPMRGRPLAITAIIVGILCTAGQVYTTVKLVQVAKIVGASIEVVFTGPQTVLEGAFEGDSAKVDEWWWPDQTPSAAQTAAFVADCRARFGDTVSVTITEGNQPPMGQATFSLPYKFTFANGVYDGTVKFQAYTDGTTTMPVDGRYVGLVEMTVVDTDGTKVVWSAVDAGSSDAAPKAVKNAAEETVEKTKE
jgi:hypothetical protein